MGIRPDFPLADIKPSNRAKRLRLVLADDCPEVVEEIVSLLQPEYDVLRSVGNGEILVEAASELRPDIVISDFNMPGLNGIDAGRRILRSGSCQSVILLTMYNDSQLIKAAVDAGIKGYVLKADAGEELNLAVRRVADGENYFSRGIKGTG